MSWISTVKKSILKHKSWKNRGTTLVEMLVCFALLGLLMASAAQVMSAAMRVYSQVKKSEAGYAVADLLCDTVESVLESANSVKIPDITSENTKISFYDKDKRPVQICVQDGYLDLVYGKGSDLSHWQFGQNVYRGYTIDSIKFLKVVDPANRDEAENDDIEYLDSSLYSANIYKVELTISKSGQGIYHAERYIKCRNMNSD